MITAVFVHTSTHTRTLPHTVCMYVYVCVFVGEHVCVCVCASGCARLRESVYKCVGVCLLRPAADV